MLEILLDELACPVTNNEKNHEGTVTTTTTSDAPVLCLLLG